MLHGPGLRKPQARRPRRVPGNGLHAWPADSGANPCADAEVGLYVRKEWFGLQRVRERNPRPVQGLQFRMAGRLLRHRHLFAQMRCRLRRLLRQHAHAAADPVPDATDAKALAADATDAEADPGPHVSLFNRYIRK